MRRIFLGKPLRFRLKFFQKFFLINTLIVVLTIVSLLFLLSNRVTSALLEKEINNNKLVVENLNDYLTQKASHFFQISRQTLYTDVSGKRAIDFLEDEAESDNLSSQDAFNQFSAYFNSVFALDPDITGISVYKISDDTLYTFSRYTQPKITKDPANFNFFTAQDQTSNDISISADHTPDYAQNLTVYTASGNVKSLTTLNVTGILSIDYNIDGIRQYLAKYGNIITGDFVVLTKDNEAVFTSSYNRIELNTDTIKNINQGKTTLSLNQESYLINKSTNNNLNLLITNFIPKKQLLHKISQITGIIYLITILFMCVALLLTFVSTRIFSKRIKLLVSSIKKMKTVNFNLRIPLTHSNDELDEIALNFNRMCESLQSYINQVYIAEIRQKSAQLVTLQTQINPHFLYNTLETIRMKGILEGARETSQMILILSRVLRNTVNNEMIISIQDELMLLGDFLELYEIRFSERLSVNVKVDHQIGAFAIPKHLLQPIVENYIIHGFNSNNSDNEIQLSSCKEGQFILFHIRDNGKGISAFKLSEIQSKLNRIEISNEAHIGLLNVNQRLKLIYGEACGLTIESLPERGTHVTLRILAMSLDELKVHMNRTSRAHTKELE